MRPFCVWWGGSLPRFSSGPALIVMPDSVPASPLSRPSRVFRYPFQRVLIRRTRNARLLTRLFFTFKQIGLPFFYRAFYRQNGSRYIIFVANYFSESSVAYLVFMHKIFKIVELFARVIVQITATVLILQMDSNFPDARKRVVKFNELPFAFVNKFYASGAFFEEIFN